MATYKVIQDIEAEDHILGPLTLRQFIFALISVFFFYISFLLITKHAAFLDILFIPPALFFGFFAVPFGRDQPTEIWALAKLRFFLKPRRRIWDQSGVKELVTITVPKKVEQHLTNGLSQYEVNSRLKTLATTLDSRGWAIKNSNISSVQSVPVFISNGVQDDSDRLIGINQLPPTPEEVAPDEADILDESTSPLAQHFDQMMYDSSQARRQQLIEQMNSQAPPVAAQPSSSQWFMPGSNSQLDAAPPQQNTAPAPIYAPDVAAQLETADDSSVVAQIKATQQARQLSSNNLRTLNPLASQPPQQNVQQPEPITETQPSLTQETDPAIISLSERNDLTIQTLSHEVTRSKSGGADEDEVVIALH